MLNVDVLDQNDNWPVFDYLYYNASVLENIGSHQNILRVTATDADSGGNGHVTFKITAGNDANKFGIDSDLGDIYTTVALDRETLDLYQLVVVASDNVSILGWVRKIISKDNCVPSIHVFYGWGIVIFSYCYLTTKCLCQFYIILDGVSQIVNVLLDFGYCIMYIFSKTCID